MSGYRVVATRCDCSPRRVRMVGGTAEPFDPDRDCKGCHLFTTNAVVNRAWGGDGAVVPVRGADGIPWPARGPGTELKALLASLGFTAAGGCGCEDRAAEMDRRGVAWCRTNRTTIEGWLREQAAKKGWASRLAAGARAVASGLALRLDPLDPAPGLLDEALRRTKPDLILAGVPDPLPAPWRNAGPWVADPAEVAAHDQAARELAAGSLPAPPPMKGRGIITCGGGRYWPGIVVLVRMLRETGSTLPVEVWYRGTCETVHPADVEGMGVTLIDADALAARLGDTRIPRGHPNVGGWESKSFALLHTTLEVVFFLDADAYFVVDPGPLLDLAADRGFVCWDEPGHNNVNWPLVGFPAGKPADAVPSIQGGQFAVHRGRCWRQVVHSRWINRHSDFYFSAKGTNPHGGSRHLFGDQDAWRLTFQLTGVRPHVLGAADFRAGWGYVFWHGGVIQIEHRCFAKLTPAGTVGEGRALRHYADHLGAGSPPGWLAPEEAALLRATCRGKRVAEWGRYRGRSTAVIATIADALWSVDRLSAAPAAAELARLGAADAATLVVGDYTDPGTAPPWAPDVVFIDGEHHRAAVLRDLDLAAALVAPGGAIAVHDHGLPNAPDVAPAADEWARANGWVMAGKARTLAIFFKES